MNKKLVLFFISLTFLFVVMTVITFSENDLKAQTLDNKIIAEQYIEKISELLDNRNNIINEFMFEGLDKSLAKERLIKIEKNEALEWDIMFLDEMDEATDYSKVKSFSIENIELKKKHENTYSFVVTINWELEYIENEIIKCEYDIELLNTNDSIYISKFNLIN